MARKKKRWELSMRKIREILRLGLEHNKGLREISRSCAVAHKTAGKYIKVAREKGLGYGDIEQKDDEQLRHLLENNCPPREKRSKPEPDWEYIHRELKKKGVTLQLLWQEYKGNNPDGYQMTWFYDFYARWKKKLNVSLRQVYKAGEKMFVDYAGQKIPIIDRDTGRIRNAEIFVAVLGASNYTYAEATWDQNLENWIGSHARSLEYFGGAPKIIVPDNLKSGVTKSCKYEPDINPTYHDMAVHYGTAIIPAHAGKPRHKAKVESGVLIVERWILAALRNRTFFSLNELNEAIGELLKMFNSRPFKKLEGCRLSHFEQFEKSMLTALPVSRYEFARWKKARVNIDYHIELSGHYYSVHYSLVHEEVDVRYTARGVEIFHSGKRVASHLRDDTRGKHSTIREHMPKSHQKYLEWTPTRIITWAGTIGNATEKTVKVILETRRHPEQGYRSCLGILRLAKRYSGERLEAACERAILIKSYRYKSIESILKNGLDKVQIRENRPEAVIEHENIRGSQYYTNLTEEALQC